MLHHISDEMVERAADARQAQDVVEEAFRAFGRGQAAMQQRERIEAEGVKLSTLGAVVPHLGIAGAKVYTTIAGRFSFVILLFSCLDGRPLATMDAAALTRRRTAASSVLMARRMARPDAGRLGVFGLGAQGGEHVRQFAGAYLLRSVLVSDPGVPDAVLDGLSKEVGLPVERADADAIVRSSDIVVTASRSAAALFRGADVAPGTFIAAVGSSLPHTRELDDATLARAEVIAVEWRRQSLEEAGDLRLADPTLDLAARTREFAEVLAEPGSLRGGAPRGLFIYKAVGVGLQDIALAGHVYRQVAQGQGWDLP